MKVSIWKKILVSLMMLVAVAVPSVMASSSAYAADFHLGMGCEKRTFLGMVPWDCGLGDIHSTADIEGAAVQIAMNVLQDLTVLAAYLVLGFVIYGGYLYMFSSGDVGKASSGRRTLINAFIGIAITILANVILNAIRIALLGSDGSFVANCAEGEAGCITAGQASNSLVTNLITWVLGVSAAIALIFVVIGGVGYVTSRGDSGKLQKAKTTILYALIGLAIVAFAEIITAFVSSTIRDSVSELPDTAVVAEV